MKEIFEFFKSNSNWIKDLFTLTFTGTATVIAILTYRRARATVLQPKRTEVVKIQTQTLVEFLKSFTDNGNNIDSSIDYINVFRYNFYLSLWSNNVLELEKNSETYKEINENLGGWYINTDNNPSGLAQVSGNLDDYFILFGTEEKRKNRPIIVLTKKSMTFINNIKNIANDPFLPVEITQIIDKIIENLYQNLFKLMTSKLNKLNFDMLANEEFIKTTPYFEDFERMRHHHIDDYIKLREKIRSYLGIDDRW